jgi:protein SCO1/2
MSKQRSALYLLLVVVAAALAGYMVSRQLARNGSPQLTSGTALQAARPLTPFALTDQLGAPFGNARLNGRPSLVFFGFTHCPDVCPTTLALLAQLQRDPALQKLQLVFVTVDPQRDDQAAMKQYVEAFSPGLVGLRGEEQQLEPLLATLGVAHIIQPRAGGDYSVDHSAALYYLNDRGELSAVFTPPFSLAALRADLVALLASGH